MKKVGLAAFDSKKLSTQQYNDLGSSIVSVQQEELKRQLSQFQERLSHFASAHASEIKNNAKFRAEFAEMCAAIGVDPLANSSSKKGGRIASFLGKDVQDFYFELAVKIVEICRQTREDNGGMVKVTEVRDILNARSKASAIKVSVEDIVTAVKTLKKLGDGLGIVKVGSQQFIKSVPGEMNPDQITVLETCHVLGFVSVSLLRDNLGWKPTRSKSTLETMTGAGLLWVDGQGAETEYWSPSWIDDGYMVAANS
ncbi:Vacuolar-sorting protein [Yarrowia sp. B02]|nr:Vacuolar-sorting protein [Yarrowia sp. B02]